MAQLSSNKEVDLVVLKAAKMCAVHDKSPEISIVAAEFDSFENTFSTQLSNVFFFVEDSIV